MTWQTSGACVGMPADIWFDDCPAYQSRARFVCSLCPVVRSCVEDAVANGDTGIRGGLDYGERLRLHPKPVVHHVHDMAVAMKGRRVA